MSTRCQNDEKKSSPNYLIDEFGLYESGKFRGFTVMPNVMLRSPAAEKLSHVGFRLLIIWLENVSFHSRNEDNAPQRLDKSGIWFSYASCRNLPLGAIDHKAFHKGRNELLDNGFIRKVSGKRTGYLPSDEWKKIRHGKEDRSIRAGLKRRSRDAGKKTIHRQHIAKSDKANKSAWEDALKNAEMNAENQAYRMVFSENLNPEEADIEPHKTPSTPPKRGSKRKSSETVSKGFQKESTPPNQGSSYSPKSGESTPPKRGRLLNIDKDTDSKDTPFTDPHGVSFEAGVPTSNRMVSNAHTRGGDSLGCVDGEDAELDPMEWSRLFRRFTERYPRPGKLSTAEIVWSHLDRTKSTFHMVMRGIDRLPKNPPSAWQYLQDGSWRVIDFQAHAKRKTKATAAREASNVE